MSPVKTRFYFILGTMVEAFEKELIELKFLSKAKFIFCLNKGEPSSKQINI